MLLTTIKILSAPAAFVNYTSQISVKLAGCCIILTKDSSDGHGYWRNHSVRHFISVYVRVIRGRDSAIRFSVLVLAVAVGGDGGLAGGDLADGLGRDLVPELGDGGVERHRAEITFQPVAHGD
jgi:hypothetical protein